MTSTPSGRRLISLATFVLVVAVLYWGRQVILPLALAALISFLLTPLVVRLHRWGLPKALAIISSVLIAFSVIAAVGGVVLWQLADLVTALPQYERNIHQKIETLREVEGPPAWQRTMEMVQEYSADLRGEADDDRSGDERNEPKPVPVEVRNGDSLARTVLTPVVQTLGTVGIVVVFVVAMLFQREDLRDRFIQVVSAGRINLTTQALDDASRRVSRYLFMQLVVNATYGIPIGIGLFFIGIPNALLWGLLATLLRFIPFLGPWIAAIFPLVLATAVDPGFGKLFATLGLFVVMELLSNNVVELLLYRAGTGISNLALLVAAVFWTWLWGPIGLFLSTPLTVCMLVLGRHVSSLRLLSILLGSEPVLNPATQFYQRMLSMDAEEMDDRARAYLARHSLLEFYSDVLAPALLLAEEDRHRGALAEVRQQFIFSSVRELVTDLERSELKPPGAEDAEPDSSVARVAIVPAGDDADELTALMAAGLVRQRGMEVMVPEVSLSPHDLRERLQTFEPDVVLISALPPHAAVQATRTCRQLSSLLGSDTPVVVGMWHAEGAEKLRDRLSDCEPVAMTTELNEAVEQVGRLAGLRRTAVPFAPDEKLSPLNLREIEPGAWLDVVKRSLASGFGVPLSLVAVTDLHATFWPEEVLAGLDKADEADAYFPLSPRSRLGPGEDLLVVEDVQRDERFTSHRITGERGIRFYAGVVLRSSTAEAVGAICIVDTRAREISESERRSLMTRARELVEAAEAFPRKRPATGTAG